MPKKRRKAFKNHASKEKNMYRNGVGPESIEAFDLSSTGNLNPQNRWVILSSIVPWEEAEAHFGAKLSASLSEGYFFLDHFSWNAFNESGHWI